MKLHVDWTLKDRILTDATLMNLNDDGVELNFMGVATGGISVYTPQNQSTLSLIHI